MRKINLKDIKKSDLLDAFDHASDTFELYLDPSDFEYEYYAKYPIEDLYQFDDIDAWNEFEPGELVKDVDARRDAESFRHEAAEWIKNKKIPLSSPIIVIDSKEGAVIGDGRGRVSISIGMGWKTIPTIIARERSASKGIGYKIMSFEDGYAVSMADSRQSFVPEPGSVFSMSPPGMWLSLDKQYVIDHYAVNDMNILLEFEFDTKDVVEGNLTDRETEFTVTKAKLIDYFVFEGED